MTETPWERGEGDLLRGGLSRYQKRTLHVQIWLLKSAKLTMASVFSRDGPSSGVGPGVFPTYPRPDLANRSKEEHLTRASQSDSFHQKSELFI